ncbi:hypothetical protein [Klenkia sp. PcliD-1-E]|nr:hypothetical protein [Klenkia sp. PcliD-1-E]MCO7218403.1 hypothetical protein [Klenkia sp. PcliD-1-E]
MWDPHAHRLVELTFLVAANLAATLLRLVLFRAWVFRSRVAERSAPASHL